MTSPAPVESPGALIGAFLSERAAASGDVFFVESEVQVVSAECAGAGGQ